MGQPKPLQVIALVLTGLAAACAAPCPAGDSSPQHVSPNILSNSGFEDGDDAWTFWTRPGDVKRATFEIDREVEFEGDGSLRVSSPAGVPANVFSAERVPCRGGTAYTLSVYARTVDGQGLQIALWTMKADYTAIEITAGATPVTSDQATFKRFSTTVVLPPECAYVRPILIAEGGTIWWDAVQLEQSAEATPYVQGWGHLEMRKAHRKVAHKYARAIIDHSRLRDVSDQLERLVVYMKEAGLDAHSAHTTAKRTSADVAALGRTLQTDAVVPTYLEFDYDAIAERLSDAIGRASDARDEAAELLAGSTDWFTRAEVLPHDTSLVSVHKRDLLKRFIVFPLIGTGPGHFRKDSTDWEMLRIFGFDAVCSFVGGWMYQRVQDGASLDEVVADRFERLDALIARNAAEGFKTSIWVEPDDIVWALQKEHGTDVYLHDADGNYYRKSRIHNSANIWHPAVVAHLERFMAEMGSRYRDNPDVLCYEIFEEPSLVLSDPRPKPGSTLAHVPSGYSAPARRAFRAYLVEEYDSLSALNEAWGTAHKSFDEIDPPQELSGPDSSTAALYDFCRFRTTSHAEFFGRLVTALQKADPVHAVVPQFIPMFYGWRSSGNDAFLLADAGWDFYAAHDWPGLGPAWETAYTYSAAHWAGKPLWNEEYIWSSWVRRDQGEAALWAGARLGVWRQFAWGKRCLELFAWDSGWDTEFEGDWNNCLLNKRARRIIPRYAAGVFPVMAARMDRLCRDVYDTRIVHDGVGMLVPTTTILSDKNMHSVIWWAEKMSRQLLTNHWKPLFFPEDLVLEGKADLDDFKVVVVPPAPLAPAELGQKLAAWVEAGGTLVWTGQFGVAGKNSEPAFNFDKLVEAAPHSPFLKGVKEAPLGGGRLVRVTGDGLNRDASLLNQIVERVVKVRAVYSSSRDVELILREAPSGDLVLVIVSLDVVRSSRTEIAARGRWGRVVDIGIDGGAPIPVDFDGQCTRFTVRTGAGEGLLISLTR